MGFLNSAFGKVFLFLLVTLLEVLLAIFLFVYGSTYLKIFAAVIVIVEMFALYKFYLYLAKQWRLPKASSAHRTA